MSILPLKGKMPWLLKKPSIVLPIVINKFLALSPSVSIRAALGPRVFASYSFAVKIYDKSFLATFFYNSLSLINTPISSGIHLPKVVSVNRVIYVLV